MAKYLCKELFLQSMGLVGDETKYGNRDREHQSRSYSTWMGYEIMGSVEDSEVEEDVVEVVHGRWETVSSMLGYLCCSQCKDVYIWETWLGDGTWNYCPNCGAKMDL